MLFFKKLMPQTAAVVVFIVAIILLSLQPSDLHQYSQPATVGYTVDIIEHGRWLLPHDISGPATKPPLFNWFSVPFVKLFGNTVFVFKLPSVVAGLCILLMLLLTARYFIIQSNSAIKTHDQYLDNLSQVTLSGLLASLIWATTPLAIKMAYFARPDMLLCVFLTAAWLLSTHLIRNSNCNHRFVKQVLLWLCVAGAALTKGPAAILVILYIFIYSKCVYKRFSDAKNTGWSWGIVLSFGLIFIWLAGAYSVSPKHVKTQLIGYEFVNRIVGTNLVFPQNKVVANQQDCVKSACQYIDFNANVMDVDWYQLRFYKQKHQRKWTELFKRPLTVLMLFVKQFLPWVILLLAWFVLVPSGKRRTHIGAGAFIWVGLVLLMFCMPTVLRGRYLLPALPAATLLAASILSCLITAINRLWVQRLAVGLVFIGCAVMLIKGINGIEKANSKLLVSGDNEVTFIQEVRSIVGNEKIVFDYFMGNNNVQALLGYSQQKSPSDGAYQRARWLIKPVDVKSRDFDNVIISSEPILTSDYVTAVTDNTIKQSIKNEFVTLGLYRVSVTQMSQ